MKKRGTSKASKKRKKQNNNSNLIKYAILGVAVLLVAIVMIKVFTGHDITNTSTCTDSDNGKNYDVKGITTNSSVNLTDDCTYCTGACIQGQPCNPTCGAVVEFYCDGETIKSETHVCDDGKTCSNGACINSSTNYTLPSPTCTDSDGGLNPYVKGNVTSSMG